MEALLKERLGWDDSEIVTTFQSRFGPEEWLKPYTVEEAERVLAERPDDVGAVLLAACSHTARGRLDRAEALFTRLTGLRPGKPRADLSVGRNRRLWKTVWILTPRPRHKSCPPVSTTWHRRSGQHYRRPTLMPTQTPACRADLISTIRRSKIGNYASAASGRLKPLVPSSSQ